MPSVSPSGGAFATIVRPSEPPAPTRFSTTTGRPVRVPSSFAIARAMPSAEAPGANGTMMRIGFCDGCAKAVPERNSVASNRASLTRMFASGAFDTSA
jgi:hypothetical protein